MPRSYRLTDFSKDGIRVSKDCCAFFSATIEVQLM